MALGFAETKPQPRDYWGQCSVRFKDVTLDNAYVAGGYAITPQQAGFGLNGVILFVFSSNTGGFDLAWVPSTGKLQVFKGGTEITGTAGAGVVARLCFLGYGIG